MYAITWPNSTRVCWWHRFLVPAVPLTVRQCRIWCPTVLTTCPHGCQPTTCSSTTVRLKHCGVRPVDVNIRSRPDPFELAALLCSQLLSFEISGSSSTLMWPCVPMWQLLCAHVLLHCDRSAVFDILCHVQPCWHCSVHLLAASWTTVALCCWCTSCPAKPLAVGVECCR